MILKRYFKYPIKPPTQAPAMIPTINTRGFAITEGISLYPTNTVAKNPAVSICPETPILNKPALNATATAREAKSIGVQAFKKLVKSVNILL